MIIGRAVDATENFLSHLAPIPLVGRAAGVVRICLGIIQTITSLALAILLTIPALLSTKCAHAWSHCLSQTLHGTKNIVAGIFEVIPIIGDLF